MGSFRVEIDIVNQNGGIETLNFEKEKLKDLTTRSYCTNDPTQPVFNVFPNEGKIIIKDTDLSLYNRAINGEFDNTYKFNVRLYKGKTPIAYHIINQRPVYDFSKKTLSLNLGNYIDNFTNIESTSLNYSGYSLTLLEILRSSFFKAFSSNYNLSFEKEERFSQEIPIPYLPEENFKLRLEKLCNATSSSIIQTEIEKEKSKPTFKIIDMLSDTYPKNVYRILPKNTRSSFKPNIILGNRFTNIITNTVDIYKEESEKNVYRETLNKYSSIKTYEDKKYNYLAEIINNDSISFSQVFACIGIKTIEQTHLEIAKRLVSYSEQIPFKIISIENFYKENSDTQENRNPNISLLSKVEVYKYKPEIKADFEVYAHNRPNIDNISWNIDNIDSNVSNSEIWEKTSEELSQQGHINYQEFVKSFKSADGSVEKQLAVGVYVPLYEEKNKIEKIENTNNFNIYSNFLIGKKFLRFSTSYKSMGGFDYEEDGISKKIPVELTQVVFTPLKVEAIYNGQVEEYKFDKNKEINSSDNKINEYQTVKGNELVQSSMLELDDKSNAKLLNTTLKEFYSNGIHTGDIEAIFSNYKDLRGNNNDKTIDTPFQIGDFVVPCSDNMGTPIIYKEQEVFSHEENIKLKISGKMKELSSSFTIYYGEIEFNFKDSVHTYPKSVWFYQNGSNDFFYEITDKGSIIIKCYSPTNTTLTVKVVVFTVQGEEESFNVDITPNTRKQLYSSIPQTITIPANSRHNRFSIESITLGGWFRLPYYTDGTFPESFETTFYSELPNATVNATLYLGKNSVYTKQKVSPIYKVVDVQIDYNGGAGSQRLQLMETPKYKLSEKGEIII